MQQKEMSNASLETKETNLVATEERVIIQTATIDLKNGKDEVNGIKQSVRVLLDSGSQRTYISKDITDKLKLTPIDKSFSRFTHLEQQSRNALKHQLWK